MASNPAFLVWVNLSPPVVILQRIKTNEVFVQLISVENKISNNIIVEVETVWTLSTIYLLVAERLGKTMLYFNEIWII